MDSVAPRTEFVRRTLEGRRYGPSEAYAHDLLELERLAAMQPIGLASAMALSHLISRYPAEADAIVRELRIRPFVPLEDERMQTLSQERLRLAELRHPLGRLESGERLGLFDF